MFKKLQRAKPGPPTHAGPIIVVSGLPRSGTSMMMKMLIEGGLQVVTDAIRAADEDNPNGYFEFEPVKQLTTGEAAWLSGAEGKLVKVISALLEYLPANRQYKVIFMERDIKEILASQQKMLQRRQEVSKTSDEELAAQFREHLQAIKYWLARQPHMAVMYVDYNRLMADPDAYCRPVAEFVGLPLDVERMRTVPNGQLYRNRAAAS
ncbi:MAG TPA: sulfotransferase [Anaerolineales bacterium]|nr:sulfotransferase [Anaerolineales bacterium]